MPAHKQRYCPLGHDTHVVGRDAGNACRECRREKAIVRQQRLREGYRDSPQWRLVEEARSRPCEDCGNTYPLPAMDLHHRDPTQKKFMLGRAEITTRAVETVAAEVAKCATLCAVCHRLRHAAV